MNNRQSGNRFTIIIVTAIIVLFGALLVWAFNNKKAAEDAVAEVDLNSYIEGNDKNGQMPDNISGSKDADIFIIEYADYQCPGCATTFPFLEEIIDEYDGQVALIYRSFVLSYHKNGTAAASAANAAARQGYWKEFAELLYANQSEWEYADVETRDNYYKEYIKEASDGKADIDKFIADMNSDTVKKKVNYDISLAKHLKVNATPTIYINGESLDFISATKDEFKNIVYEKIDNYLTNKHIKNKRTNK